MARTLAMCEKAGVDATGLAVNALNLLPSRGNSWWEIYTTRLGRFMRESALSWLFIVGLYDDFSQEAEVIEPKKNYLLIKP